ncbi:SDR family oxidoreductase [Methanosarcina sp.]|uniref:SDR family oxidoreductase n=1 Tax=Methanosarcina sp. TaxID=2213 RepID=UPI002ABB2308|nr:SDR family oxidoreductase [Methanosarcina sp.]MDY9924665.1 SDR family oxidoreductase [Methanosarcina sp.]
MKNLFDLTGKVAIVTGASSGLGVDFARALANQGANIAIVARREEKLKEVQKEIEEIGVTCRYYVCDVMKTEQIKSTVEQVEKDLGRIDILVNNAGLGLVDAADKTTDEMWRSMIDTNLNGVFFFAREVGKVMLKQKYGRIINIGSIHSTVSMKGMPVTAYCSTKGGVLMLTKSLATEWAKEGITVNAIGPGYFALGMAEGIAADPEFLKIIEFMCPMGRAGKSGDLDTTVVYLASEASRYITGQIITVDGGWTAL